MRPSPSVLPSLLLAPALAAQCAVVADVIPGSGGFFPQPLYCAHGDQLYFTGSHPQLGSELWRWTAATGVHLVTDLNPGSANALPQSFAAFCSAIGPRLFFAGFRAGSGSEPWITDGTAAGTTMLANIRPGNDSSTPSSPIACDELVFFGAHDGTHGIEPWVTDGTPAGTRFLLDIEPGPFGSQPEMLASFRGRAYFTAFTSSQGRELWVSDGTTAGTQMLLDINAGTGSASITDIEVCGDRMFFSANAGSGSSRLWISDGTAAGTTVLNPTPFSSLELTCCNGTLFFTAVVSANGRELWKSDGTPGGTVMIADLYPGHLSSDPRDLTCSGNRVFFSAQIGNSHGRELWVSDGTAAGTFEVADIVPGASSSFPQVLAAVGTGVCFHALDSRGRELWFSDGTAANTFQVCDIHPSGDSNPAQLTTCAGRLLFVATEPSVGTELFEVATPGATQQALGVAGRPARPTLAIRDGAPPVVGTTIDAVASGPAGHTGFLFANVATPPSPALPLPWMDGGCDFVGMLAGSAIFVASGAPPGFSHALPVPAQPSLEGVMLNLQVAWANLAATPALQVSNAIRLALGGAVPH